MDFKFKDKYTIEDLLEIVKILRSENGCPWDKEQTHESIRGDFLEEVYEAIEAIDNNDKENLCEELGDVLLQVVFHTDIEKDAKCFDFDDVTDGVCKKLIIRHPHVFGDVVAETTDAVLTNWDKIKQETKGQETYTEVLKSIPKGFPALMRSRKVQKKAAKYGMDWNSAEGALSKIHEETDELAAAISAQDAENAFEEMGDLLFSVVNVSRFAGIDAEEALAKATDKFIHRFEQCEDLARERGIDMAQADAKQLDDLWNEVKGSNSSGS